MSDYAEDLVRQWEIVDPRDRWHHTGEKPPSARVRNSEIGAVVAPVQVQPLPLEAEQDLLRMLICDICGSPACFGFGVTVDGIRMGDVGSWRCVDHPHDGAPNYSREQWAAARAEGRLYPNSKPGEWQELPTTEETVS